MSVLMDLRSDTVTRPDEGMRRAMMLAEVGDDVFAEDPTVATLEARVAGLLGKAAALFVPSGTMANQLAIMGHCQRGDEVIIGEGAHCAFYESGAGAALSGVQFMVAGRHGLFTADDMEANIRAHHDWYPRTRLVALENTHNRGGGRVFPHEDTLQIASRARAHGLSLHLDGARLWNASVATGLALDVMAAPFDTVSVCLSKGLGAPVGSLLVGDAAFVRQARRHRKMLGGGMRQSGVLAAAGLYAIDHHREGLAHDHLHAAELFRTLQPHLAPTSIAPETNIVMLDLPEHITTDADAFAAKAREHGVLLSVFGPRRLRAVTHHDVSQSAVARAAEILRELLRS